MFIFSLSVLSVQASIPSDAATVVVHRHSVEFCQRHYPTASHHLQGSARHGELVEVLVQRANGGLPECPGDDASVALASRVAGPFWTSLHIVLAPDADPRQALLVGLQSAAEAGYEDIWISDRDNTVQVSAGDYNRWLPFDESNLYRAWWERAASYEPMRVSGEFIR